MSHFEQHSQGKNHLGRNAQNLERKKKVLRVYRILTQREKRDIEKESSPKRVPSKQWELGQRRKTLSRYLMEWISTQRKRRLQKWI